ncbi:MAG: FecR domain-containing protein [Myxococcota bacterium]
MSATCQETQSWMSLQGAQEVAFEDSARHAAHLAICSGCQGRLQGYHAMLLNAQSALDFEASEHAAEAFVASAVQLSPQVRVWRETAAGALAFSPSAEGANAFLHAARQETALPHTSSPVRGVAWPMLAAAAGLLVALTLWGTRDDAPISVVPHSSPMAIEIAQRSGSVWVNGALITEDVLDLTADGARIVTGERSDLTLKDDAGDVVTLSSRSELTVEDWRRRSRQLTLKAGSVHARVSHRRDDERFEVLTPNARVIVVGTEFTVTFSETHETVVTGNSGTVRVERRDGTLVGFVKAGDVLRIPAQVGATSPVKPSSEAPSEAPPTAATPDPLEGEGEGEGEPSTPTLQARPSTPAHSLPPARVRHSDKDKPTIEAVAPPDEAPQKATVQAAKAAVPPLQQARTWLGEGREAEAIALLEATPSRDWRRDALLGDAYQLNGRFERALTAYQDALQKTSRAPAAVLADMASLLDRRLKRSDKAEAAWSRYLSLYPQGSDAAKALLYLAERARTTGRDDEASERYRSLLERFPHKAQASKAFTRLGSGLLRAKRWREAEALFTPHMLAGTHTKAEVALVGMIRVRMAQGQRDKAARLITRYQTRFPSGSRGAEVQRLNDALSLPKPATP